MLGISQQLYLAIYCASMTLSGIASMNTKDLCKCHIITQPRNSILLIKIIGTHGLNTSTDVCNHTSRLNWTFNSCTRALHPLFRQFLCRIAYDKPNTKYCNLINIWLSNLAVKSCSFKWGIRKPLILWPLHKYFFVKCNFVFVIFSVSFYAVKFNILPQ